jgi:signal peptidase I
MSAAAEREKSTIREYWEALLIAIIFVNFARVFVFQAFKIPTGSMEDNLKVGDHIIVNKFIYGPTGDGRLSKLIPARDVERGDIIVFRYPKDPDVDYVKRVIGVPGDTISIRDKKVSVNGRDLDEPYVTHIDRRVFPAGLYLPEPYRSRDQFGPFTVPQGQYFAMGDNRDNSNDSRFWGTVPRANIKGRAFLVYWSFENRSSTIPETPSQHAKALGTIARHFFDWTRWDRTFFIVDSRYHYTPGVSSDL